MKIIIVYDNCVAKFGLEAGWGFSALIVMENAPPILFDTGGDGASLFHNMRELGIDPGDIATVVISHAHGDHTGGLWDIQAVNSNVEVYVPASSGVAIPGGKVVVVTESIQISQDVFSTGELRGVEQSLVLKTDNGIVVVTGCSHPGVGEILNVASQFGNVYGLIGGLHGFHDFDRLRHLSFTCPCHCTDYKSEIARLFPEQYIPCGAGLELEL